MSFLTKIPLSLILAISIPIISKPVSESFRAPSSRIKNITEDLSEAYEDDTARQEALYQKEVFEDQYRQEDNYEEEESPRSRLEVFENEYTNDDDAYPESDGYEKAGRVYDQENDDSYPESDDYEKILKAQRNQEERINRINEAEINNGD